MAETENPDLEDSKEQPLISHLIELRDRLVRCFVLILVLFLCIFPFGNDLYIFVSKPLIDVLPEGSNMIATGVTSPFMIPFKTSIYAAIFLAVPFILHQAWAFISPGLYRNEIRVTMPILLSSVVLFYLGIAFAYFLVFNYVFAFFVNSAPETVAVMTDITQYLDFVLSLFLVFGLVFEIPIATLLLIFSGVTTPKKLVEKRPYIIIGCFVAGMFLTPQDPLSQAFVAIPMWMLFEIGVIAGRILHKEDEEEVEEETEESESSEQDSEEKDSQ
ncbi:MAG: twin-arginine translocase subunit TatC [Gammaproteobacteria bacterium]|jgi:sec-independent protein translocase protein TatC|nr:twin-arginine translocase subunit TatC [Gammaproteobacteria bacterium]MBT6043422.1 twin-arginine translocase subunit TatC [Gammaproteobacteria bacterium]